MGYSDPDVYYQPEYFDLEIVGTLELAEPCWSFDMFAVFKHADGRTFWAQDSGCSCPSPFENYNSLESLNEFSNVSELRSEIINGYSWDSSYLSLNDIDTWLAELRRKL